MTIQIQCSCGQVLQTGDENAGKTGRCPKCGTLFQIPFPAGGEAPQEPASGPDESAAQPAPEPVGGGAAEAEAAGQPPPEGLQAYPIAQPVYGPVESPYGDEVYNPTFPVGQIDPRLLESWRMCQLTTFSVAGAAILNVVTSGLFGLIFYGIQHGKLPRASRRDFGTGRAIGFMFIPFYNLYWAFRFWCGLADRINLQLRLRNPSHPLVPRSLAIAVCILKICGMVPYLGCLVVPAEIICEVVLVCKVQDAINSLSPPYPYQYQYQPPVYPPAPPMP